LCDTTCKGHFEYSGPLWPYAVTLLRKQKGFSAEYKSPIPDAHPAHASARIFVTFIGTSDERLRLLPFCAVVVRCETLKYELDDDNNIVAVRLLASLKNIVSGLPVYATTTDNQNRRRASCVNWVCAMALCRYWHPHVSEHAVDYLRRVLSAKEVLKFVQDNMCFKTSCLDRLRSLRPQAHSLIGPTTDPTIAMIIADSAFYLLWYGDMNIECLWSARDHSNNLHLLDNLRTCPTLTRKPGYPVLLRPTVSTMFSAGRSPKFVMHSACVKGTCHPTLQCRARPHRMVATIETERIMLRLQGADRLQGPQCPSTVGNLARNIFLGHLELLHPDPVTGSICAHAFDDTHTILTWPQDAHQLALSRAAYQLALSTNTRSTVQSNSALSCVGPDVHLYVDHSEVHPVINTLPTRKRPRKGKRAAPTVMFGAHKTRKKTHVYPCLAPANVTS
jgi:hypothetical protein